MLNKIAEFCGLSSKINNKNPDMIDEAGNPFRLDDYILYEASEGDIFTLKGGYLGFAIEVSPIVGMSDELDKNIRFFFADELRENFHFQVTLIASHRIGNMLSQWSEQKTNQDIMIKEIIEERHNFLKEKALNYNSPIIVRDFKIIISVSHKTKDLQEFVIAKAHIVRQLSTLGLNPTILNCNEFAALVSEIINMTKETSIAPKKINLLEPINIQITRGAQNILVHNDRIDHLDTGLSTRLLQVDEYPEKFSLSQMINLLGDGTKDSFTIPGRFILSLSVSKTIKNSENYIPKGQSVIHSAEQFYSRHNVALQEEASEWISIIDSIKKGEKILKCSMFLMITTDKLVLEDASSRLISLYNICNWKMRTANNIQLLGMVSILPMQVGYYLSALDYFKITTLRLSNEILAMLPLHAEWKGVPISGVPLIARRGQLFNWNPFYRISGGNYNVCIFGPSGSGKSVFLQELTVTMLSQNTKIFILDIGQSFKNLCLLFGGEMVKFSPDMDISLNPFSAIEDESNKEALMCLQSIISSMCGAENNADEAQIEKAIVNSLKKYKNKANISIIAEELELLGSDASKRMSISLFPYTKEGKYGHFFDKESNIYFNKQLTVFEFEEIKNDQRLLSVILQMISMQIFLQVLTGDRQTQFMLIVDEAWMILDYCAKFLSDLARTIRKYGGSLVVCVQSYDDFQKTEEHRTIFQNSTWTIMLKQDEKGLNSFKQSEAFKDMLPLIKSIQFRPGRFSECLVYTTGLQIIGRMILDKYSATLFSTDAADFNFIDKQIKNGVTMGAATRELMRMKESKLR